MKHQTLNSNKGFTLLEIMVVLGILGFLATLAARNFEPSMEAQNYLDATTSIQEIEAAAVVYVASRQEMYTNVDIPALIKEASLDASYGTGEKENPWGGDYKIEVGDEIYQYKVTLTNVKPDQCAKLAQEYSQTGGSCTDKTFTKVRG